MAFRDWVRLPSRWIEEGGLRQLRWGNPKRPGADIVAALMVLVPIAHNADDQTGLAKCTYDDLCNATGLSRAKLSAGLKVLETINVIEREPEGRSTFKLVNYDPAGGWCKLPAKRLYSGGSIIAFENFNLRNTTELHALKLYFLFAARRGNDTNMAHLSYDKIETYSGVERLRIKKAISFLAAIGLIYVEHIPSNLNDYGMANAYRLAFLEPYFHLGTRGRRMNGDFI